jgi:hypothetical protein
MELHDLNTIQINIRMIKIEIIAHEMYVESMEDNRNVYKIFGEKC